MSNSAFANVLLAAKTNEGRGQLATMSFNGNFWKNWNWSLAYTYTEQTEVSGLTSCFLNSIFNARQRLIRIRTWQQFSVFGQGSHQRHAVVREAVIFKGYKTRIGMFYLRPHRQAI